MKQPRPQAPLSHSDEREHRRQIAMRANAALSRDGVEPMTGPLSLAQYTVATVPVAADWRGSLIYVTNETGGEVPAFSDGTNWRRVTDRAVIA